MTDPKGEIMDNAPRTYLQYINDEGVNDKGGIHGRGKTSFLSRGKMDRRYQP